jgi:cellulose synthase/poly-beta-1,6-N-acetylglucosamine synthase-like glycosyltransferase
MRPQLAPPPSYTLVSLPARADSCLTLQSPAAGRGRYLCEYLAVGEAPDEARNLFRQRSRWTKGHMQIFFSLEHCPLMPFNGLNLAMKLLYTNGTWAYFCNIFTTPTFLVVPFISLMFGIHPVIFSKTFAVAAVPYLLTNFLVMNYFRWGGGPPAACTQTAARCVHCPGGAGHRAATLQPCGGLLSAHQQ